MSGSVEIVGAFAGVIATILVLASIVFQAGKQSARVDSIEREQVKTEAKLEKWQRESKADIEKWQQDTKDEIVSWRVENRQDLQLIRDSISNIREAVVARRVQT